MASGRKIVQKSAKALRKYASFCEWCKIYILEGSADKEVCWRTSRLSEMFLFYFILQLKISSTGTMQSKCIFNCQLFKPFLDYNSNQLKVLTREEFEKFLRGAPKRTIRIDRNMWKMMCLEEKLCKLTIDDDKGKIYVRM